jgi:antitoxin MazE
MKVSVVRIGNSRGIRIPKAILDQCQVKAEVELEIQDGKIVLDPNVDTPRGGWDEQFRHMAEEHDDQLLMDDALDVDVEAWDW